MSFRGIVIYAITVIFLFYEIGLQMSPGVMTDDLMRDFGIGAQTLGIMSSCYFISYSFMQIPVGILFDRFGPRFLTTLAILVCAAGAFFFATTHTVSFAALGRFFMGFGSAFAFVCVLVASARWFAPVYFALLVGIAQLLAALGAIGGSYPFSYAVNIYGWRPVMSFLAVLGVVLAVAAFLIVKDFPRKTLQRKQKHAAFLRHLWDAFVHGQTWWIALYAFCGWGPAVVIAGLWGVPFLMARFGVMNTEAAGAISMLWIGFGLASPIVGWLSDWMKRRTILTTISAAVGFITTAILLYMPGISFGWAYVLLFFFGVAASGQLLTFALVRDINKPAVTASAIGFNNMAVVIGGFIFQPLVGWILSSGWDGTMHHGVQVYSIHDYQVSLAIVPLCYLIGFFVSLLAIKETHCKHLHGASSEDPIA